jgi:predicted acylesterase/phospholipase RssA
MVKNLVLSGAGLKCWAYIGTLRALNEYDLKDIEHVIGASAGAIFGLMYILGAKSEFLLKYFIDNNVHDSHDVDIDNILSRNSLFVGTSFNKVIKTLITYYVDTDITFKQLFDIK